MFFFFLGGYRSVVSMFLRGTLHVPSHTIEHIPPITSSWHMVLQTSQFFPGRKAYCKTTRVQSVPAKTPFARFLFLVVFLFSWVLCC